ncbi:MAG: lipoprotein-releasing ABC transporter permease subunit [Alphaproteobacteria bacterium]|nr:lipoprotein-releasing ABC transporter permease subunit [Alphaproteobacteria bacterium]
MEARVVERPFGPFERMLALRYLGAKREHGGLAFISIVSVIGITLGVWALILTMSIMNGFRLELISKIVGFEPHIYLDTSGLPQPQVDGMMEDLLRRPGVVAVEPIIEDTALASAHGRSEGVQVRGVRPKDLRANQLIHDGMAKLKKDGGDVGSLDSFGESGPLSPDIVVGEQFAQAMGLYVGDKIQLTQPNGSQTIAGMAPRTRVFTVSAIFNVGNERYDRYSIFLPIESAKNFFGVDDGYPILGIRIDHPDNAEAMTTQLATAGLPIIGNWITRNSTYVTALIVERNVMRLILFIVVIITALNIITGILMLVKNKARDIAILRTIGATRSGVVRVFLMTGSFLGMAGVLTGLMLGVLCSIYIAPIQHTLEGILHVQLFPKDIYQLDALPAHLQWSEVAWVTISAFVVTLVMSIIPALWAARLDPVDALRFQ